MDILKLFVFDNTSHNVNILLDENNDPLFRASDIGKVLSITNIHTSIVDFDEEEKVLRTTSTHGGAQASTFLTEQGVFKLIMRSRKPIARPFQKWVFNLLITIRKTGKYDLQTEIEQIKGDMRKLKDGRDEELHKTLVEGFDNKPVVYFGKIKTIDDGRVLVKIGCTKNIRSRLTGLKMEFGNMSILKIFECDNHEPFEKFLHNHQDIRRYSYKELINGMKKSQEVFCLTEQEIKRAMMIATRNVCQFRMAKKRDQGQLYSTVRELCSKVGVPFNEDVDVDSTDVPYANKRGRCTLTGPKIQAYSEDGSRLIKTYEILIDAVRDVMSDGGSQAGIQNAYKNRTVKYGHRWAQLDRSEPDDKVQDIGETMEDLTSIRTGLVAGMNDDRSEVIKVYTSFKACGVENGFVCQGAVQKRVKKGVKVGGHHIVRWVEIPEEVQDKWLENNALPEIKKNATSIKINRLDPETSKVLKTYGTMNEVKLHFKIGQHALKNAIKGNVVKRGFKWAYAE